MLRLMLSQSLGVGLDLNLCLFLTKVQLSRASDPVVKDTLKSCLLYEACLQIELSAVEDCDGQAWLVSKVGRNLG